MHVKIDKPRISIICIFERFYRILKSTSNLLKNKKPAILQAAQPQDYEAVGDKP